MSVLYHPFDSGAGASVYEAQWRKMAQHWLATGVLGGELNQFKVTADGSGMTVDVDTGKAWIKGHYVESDAIEALSIDAADPANPRIDRVILRATYSQPGTPGSVALAVLKGVAAGSPSAPALTQNTTLWEISLAQVRVDAAAVVVAANKVTSERVFVWTGGDVAVLDRVTSTTQIVNSNVETTIYTKTISADLLGANGGLKLNLGGDHFNNSGSARLTTIRVKIGATTILTFLPSMSAAAVRYGWHMQALLLNAGAADAQRANGAVVMPHSLGDIARAAYGVATEDSAADKNLVVTAQLNVANANYDINMHIAELELIRPTA